MALHPVSAGPLASLVVKQVAVEAADHSGAVIQWVASRAGRGVAGLLVLLALCPLAAFAAGPSSAWREIDFGA
jgi:hypothetical protein